jgi:glycosyltransferase involved in cell wall biosynthesis
LKILCVIDSLTSGGAQRQLVELALGFKEKGNDVQFLTYHYIPFYNATLEKRDISITLIQEPNYLKRLLKMRYFIRRGKFDVVLSFLEASNFICEISGLPYRNWKLVVGERNANPALLKSPKLVLYRWFHFFADYIVANSYMNIEFVKKINPLLKRSKCKTIYNLIDFNHWEVAPNNYRKKSSKLKLVVLARHSYQKNLIGLINALSLLSKQEKEIISVEWYGDGATGSYVDETYPVAIKEISLSDIRTIISFHPASHNVLEIIQESDIVGLFSLYEGLPNAICEAMACGKPVICSNVSDMSRILTYDKNLLFNPKDPHSIKDVLSYILSLGKDQLIEIGLTNAKIAKEKFKKEEVISKYLELFK